MIPLDNIKNVLISPLDWGLGHTTRCIPIIKYFIAHQCQIFIACEPDSPSEHILKQQIPTATYLPLKGYGIVYGKSSLELNFKIILQIPKILSAIKNERKKVEQFVATHNIDLVISDNRYGFCSKTVPSIFITHQLRIKMPLAFLEPILQKINYRYIHQFSSCWIPDFEDKQHNLAGDLSHPEQLPRIPIRYIGTLNHLPQITTEVAKPKYDFLFLLSGPEPQRSILESKLLSTVSFLHKKILLVRGLPKSNEPLQIPNVTCVNYLDTASLAKTIHNAQYIVARSGYSTIMELITQQKKAILIPTPGQTEQEYLAHRLHQLGWAYSIAQDELNDGTKLLAATQFQFSSPIFNSTIDTEYNTNNISKQNINH